MRVAVLGRTHWLLAASRRLMEAGHNIVLVATAAAAPEYKAHEDDFAALASDRGAPFMLSPDVNGEAFRNAFTAAKPDVAISVNWPQMIRRDACTIPPHGILNAHAGDLPRYRGNACPNWAILNGEPHVGLCIHRMDPDVVDAGPVFARRRMPIDDSTYIADVYAWMDGIVPELFCEAVNRLAASGFQPEDQSASGVRPLRCHPRRPEDGVIDWREDAIRIARLVRASSRPFAGAFSHFDGGERVTIWRVQPAQLDHDVLAVPGQILGRSRAKGVLVACGTGALEIEEADLTGGGALQASNRHRFTNGAATR